MPRAPDARRRAVNSRLQGARTVRVGKRTIGEGLGKGTRSRQANYQHIDEKLKNLARDGFIQIGDADRSGTLYAVRSPPKCPPFKHIWMNRAHRPPPRITTKTQVPERSCSNATAGAAVTAASR